MANPNIVNVTSIYGGNNKLEGTTSVQAFINNAASSGKVFKVNNIVVANTTVSTTSNATVYIYSEDDLGGTAYAVINAIPIPPETSLIAIDKSTSFYLKEDQSVGVLAGDNSALTFSASWEEIS